MKLKHKIKSDEGFVLGIVYMMFLVLMLSLTSLSMNVHSNSKYTGMSVSNDVAFYFSDYGVQKVQDTVNKHIESATPAKLKEYVTGKVVSGKNIPGTKILVDEINDIIMHPNYFGEDIWEAGTNNTIRLSRNLKALTAKIHFQKIDPDTGLAPTNPYVLIVTSTVRDTSRGFEATNISKVGSRLSTSKKSQDYTNTPEELAKLYRVLFSSIVEVGKDNPYEEAP